MVRLFFLIRLIAPCQGNQDSLGFWNPRRGFRISGTGFQSLSVELGFWIPSAIQCDSGFLSAVFWIQKPRIADSTSKNFPDSTNQILCLHEMRSRKALNSALHETRDFKMPRRRRQQERQKSNWLNKQNNNSARAPRLFVHFFTVTATTRGKCLNSRFMKEVNKRRLIFCFFLNLNMILRNSAQKEFACISQSKRVRVMRI